MNEDEKGKLAERLLVLREQTESELEHIKAKIDELEQRISSAEAARLGRKLMNLAGHFAVEAGKVEGRGLFESYEWSQERDKVDADARALLLAWSTSWSREELSEKLGATKTETISGLMASRRLLEHYIEVLNAFEPSGDDSTT